MLDQKPKRIPNEPEKQGRAGPVVTSEDEVPLMYLRRRQAAQYLRDRGIPGTEKTLAKLASTAGGPTYRLFGRIPLYTPADLDRYIATKLGKPVRSTSEYEGEATV